jgi:acyl carrier protein
MTQSRDQIADIVRLSVSRIKRNREITLETELFGADLAMDSLETAELSAILEDEFGSDPYSEGELPVTVGEIVDFFVDRV